jgi:hypothetical protein
MPTPEPPQTRRGRRYPEADRFHIARLPSSPSDETLPTPYPLITRFEFPSLRLGTRLAPPGVLLRVAGVRATVRGLHCLAYRQVKGGNVKTTTPMAAIAALVLASIALPAQADHVRRTYEVVVQSSAGATFTDCFRFDRPQSTVLTIDGLGSILYTHGGSAIAPTVSRGCVLRVTPRSVSLAASREKFRRISGEAVNNGGVAFVFSGRRREGCGRFRRFGERRFGVPVFRSRVRPRRCEVATGLRGRSQRTGSRGSKYARWLVGDIDVVPHSHPIQPGFSPWRGRPPPFPTRLSPRNDRDFVARPYGPPLGPARSQNVSGPSLVSLICIRAPKRPRATIGWRARARSPR